MNDDDMVLEVIVEETKTNKTLKTAKDWENIGLEFYKRRLKDPKLTSKKFAEELGIVYSTFTKSMFRYKNRIQLRVEIERAESDPKMRVKRKTIENKLVQDFRDSVKKLESSKGKKTEEWFARTLSAGVRSHKASKPRVGRIYTMIYDAKHKDKLEVWDKFPLYIFLGSGIRGQSYLMYGLNLHYIPRNARMQFLEQLLRMFASTKRLSNNTRLKVNWSKVKGMRGSDLMIKSYLPNHIRGTLLEINPKDWANVALMPTQKFIGKDGEDYSARKVWAKY